MEMKRTIWHVLICVGLVCLIWGGYFAVCHFGIDRIINIKDDDFSWMYQVDSVDIDGAEIEFSGFAFQLEKDSIEGAVEIVLEDIKTGKRYYPKMEYRVREDVNDYFLCEFDYLQSGFLATIKTRKIDLEKGDYEILLKVKEERLTYRTGMFFSKGKIVYANPIEFVPLDVEGTDLEEIVENGKLRVYRPDYGMYVYQYDGILYWIAEPNYGFVNNDSYIQYQLDTTQIERLPKYRLDNQWYWDNRGFMFGAEEVLDFDAGKYRVAGKELPTEYAIEKIWTGKCIEEWIWQQDFRPYYEFKE